MHRTNTPGSSVTFKFNGTAAWYFSDMNPTHGTVNITIDGVYSYTVDGYASPPVCPFGSILEDDELMYC